MPSPWNVSPGPRRRFFTSSLNERSIASPTSFPPYRLRRFFPEHARLRGEAGLQRISLTLNRTPVSSPRLSHRPPNAATRSRNNRDGLDKLGDDAGEMAAGST